MENKGITLIALIMSIIILILLAGVTIGLVVGENGLIAKVKLAVEMHELEAEKERLEVIKQTVAINNEGTVTVDKYIDKLIDLGITTLDNVTDNKDESKQLITDKGFDVNVKPRGENDIIVTINGRAEGGKDDIVPTKAIIQLTSTTFNTGESITATITHQDEDSGVNIEKCRWGLTTSDQPIGVEEESQYTGGNFTCSPQDVIITASLPGNYYLHVLTVDKAGNKIETVSEVITVNQLVTKVSMTPTTITMDKGSIQIVTAKIEPDNASNKTINWSSNNDNIVEVNANGQMTAKNEGTAVVTATAADGSGKSATCSITVKAVIVTKDMIAANPTLYYGKIVTGYHCNKSGYAWQIYHADNNNIYITTTDYIKATDCPNGIKGTAMTANDTYKPSLNEVYKDYNGSTSITNDKVKSWFSYLSSSYGTNNTYITMKKTAYLLDTSAWANFKGEKADYAIGAPTLDLFAASYKKTHPSKYIQFQSGKYGYELKWNTDTAYANWVTGAPTDEFNKLYMISSTTKASNQWIASPSQQMSNIMIGLGFNGDIGQNWSFNGNEGIRPIVCLSSSVSLEQIGSGSSVSYLIK